jgi:HSP20 family molecular chaperone IbpA
MRKSDRREEQQALYDTLMDRIKNGFKPEIEVFENDDTVFITLDAGYLNEGDIKLEVDEETVSVHIDNKHLRFFKKINLPSKVNLKSIMKKFKNGVLDVSVEKAD